jgi:superfamily II DNA or RNA helicase
MDNLEAVPEPGQIVRVRTRTYLVEGVSRDSQGSVVRMFCLDDDAQGQELEVLWDLELDKQIVNEDVWKSIGSKGFDSPRFFSSYVHTLRWNCVTATDPRLFQAPFRAGIRLDAYQLEPLRKALLLPRVNLFIADDVGLGKTIEAGLIAGELLLRQRVREIVVVCPPSLVPQWKDEMESRFGLTFEVLDREYVEKVRREHGYGVNPWKTYPRFLISNRLLIEESYAGPLRDWLDNLRPGSLLIFDEAHHAAPSSGSRYAIDSRITRSIRDIAPRFEHRLFLSATPHNGHSNSFSALLELLDPQRFTRGVPVVKENLNAVMVRRLKEDIRAIAGGFPVRRVVQIDLQGLPPTTPELALSRLLDEYRQVRQQRMAEATKRKQAEAGLLISGLQQRLLSSAEAFARTLAVHRRTMERVWQNPAGKAPPLEKKQPRLQRDLLAGSLDRDDERTQLPEADLKGIEDAAMIAATESSAGNATFADEARERKLLAEMETIAEAARGVPDQRIRHLVNWIRQNMCSGARIPGEAGREPGAKWTDLRLLIFTEYEDTKRYLVNMLNMAIAGTERCENRIEVFHGPTPPDKREAIKRAFNMAPALHPVRILVATDAAREGINLQAHCWNLFHFDVPWNPGRLEQRNGRIDRKLQPSPEVFCHYFVYNQRPEDRVLRALVRKTDIIRVELGSLSQVLESRLAEALQRGIRHDEVDKIEAEIVGAELDADQRAITESELEASRERQEALVKQIDNLRTRLSESRKWIGMESGQLRDALSCSLELLGAAPLHAVTGTERFEFPNLDCRLGADPSWATTLDTLRALPEDGERSFEWRRSSPIRPVVFEAPEGIDDDVVQLHLNHRVVQRLLSRFLSQGFVHHDLSRACLAQSADAIPRVVLLGRLSLYGAGAVRLHEEVLTVTARWHEPAGRRDKLTPYAREAEDKTLGLLETALQPDSQRKVSKDVAVRLQASIARDIEELLPHLETRGQESRKDAVDKLTERGRIEADAIRKVLEEQRRRVQAELGRAPDFMKQLLLDLGDSKSESSEMQKRQFESNRRYWQRWLENVDGDLQREPARILDFYKATSYRIEPVGLAYLWPVSN